LDPRRPPLLASLTPFTRLLFSVLLVIASFSFLFLAGLLLAGPIFGIGPGDLAGALSDYDDPNTLSVLQYFQVIQTVGMFILPPLLAGWFFTRNTGGYLSLSVPARPQFYILTLLLVAASLPLINWLIALNEGLELPAFLHALESWMRETEDSAARLTEAFMVMPSAGALWFNLLMIAVLPALGEELMFRGLVQRLLGDWLGNVHLAIFLASVLFGAMHMQFYGLLPRIVLGLMLGYLFYWSGSLWVPVFGHLLNNGAAVMAAWLVQHGHLAEDWEEFVSTDISWGVALSVVVTAALLFAAWRYSVKSVES